MKKIEEELRDLTRSILSIDLDKCYRYAEKKSEREFEEFLYSSPDAYISDGVYASKYDWVEDAILEYVHTEFSSKIRELHNKFGNETDVFNGVKYVYNEKVSNVVIDCSVLIYREKENYYNNAYRGIVYHEIEPDNREEYDY